MTLRLMTQSQLERTARRWGHEMWMYSLRLSGPGSSAPLGDLWKRLWAYPGYQRLTPGSTSPSQAWPHSPKGRNPDDEICLQHWTVFLGLRNIRTTFGKEQWRPGNAGKETEWSQSSRACAPVSAQPLTSGVVLDNPQNISGLLLRHLQNGKARLACSQVCPDLQIRWCCKNAWER